MKKKIVNAVELALYIASVVLLFTMEGISERHSGGNVVKVVELIAKEPVYSVGLAVLWGFGILMCVLSILSKSEKRDGSLHVALPIMTMLFTDFCLLGIFSKIFMGTVLNGLMFAIIVVSFIKRSAVIVE